ncbi:MAG TPA: hypothetical protein VGK54_13765 [Chloroflexota bacterium]|jgi:hypothetical protein
MAPRLRSRLPRIRSELLESLDRDDDPRFFSANPAKSGDLPARSGYYAGARALASLMGNERFPGKALLRADPTRATCLIRSGLAA